MITKRKNIRERKEQAVNFRKRNTAENREKNVLKAEKVRKFCQN
jgi:hypothetical protein